MSRENVDVVGRSFDSFNAGELDTFLEGMADDAELWPDASFPWEPGTTVTWLEAEEAGDKVLVSFQWRAVGGSSGIATSSDWYTVNTFRRGQVVRVQFFSDQSAARKAAGLA